MSMLKYFISLILLGAPLSLSAQIGRWAPSAVRIGVEPGALGYMIFSEKRSFFEATADLDINNFYLAMDYGINTFKLDEPTYQYENNGRYMRFGMDINLMKADKIYNVMFFGLRYARSVFNDELKYQTSAVIQSDTRWPSAKASVSNSNVKSNWIEMTVGMKIRIFKQLYAGFTARYKFLKSIRDAGNLKPYYIPGFGKNINNDAWGLNYYIYYRIPFRKKVIYVRDEPGE